MHVHISAMNVVINALGAILVIALLNWVSMKFPDSNLSASWQNLMNPSA